MFFLTCFFDNVFVQLSLSFVFVLFVFQFVIICLVLFHLTDTCLFLFVRQFSAPVDRVSMFEGRGPAHQLEREDHCRAGLGVPARGQHGGDAQPVSWAHPWNDGGLGEGRLRFW